jgi:hypothetical protein
MVMELHQVADSNQTQAVTDDPQSACGFGSCRVGISSGVNASVVKRASGRVDVLQPDTLNPMQKTSPRAEEEVVER